MGNGREDVEKNQMWT